MTRPIRLEAILIEEIELPRPHYKARLNVHMFRDPATSSATVGLIPNEIAVTVHVPIDVGTDLKVIKQAAIDQALDDIKLLMQLSAEPHTPCHQSIRSAVEFQATDPGRPPNVAPQAAASTISKSLATKAEHQDYSA